MPVKVVVVGAGPAGCTSAIRVARLPNVEVQLLEKLSLRAFFEKRSKGFCIILNPRGLNALKKCSLDLPSTRHTVKGSVVLPSSVRVPFQPGVPNKKYLILEPVGILANRHKLPLCVHVFGGLTIVPPMLPLPPKHEVCAARKQCTTF
jgi:hypothetical protein